MLSVDLHYLLEKAFSDGFTIDNLSNVTGVSIDLINRVVKADSPKSFIFEQQADYYTALCKLMRLKSLPSAVFPSMQQKFNSIFVQLYTQAKQTYISKINQINSQLLLAKQQSNSIKQATPSLSFLRDLTSDEDTLLKACSDCNMLRTRKEMLEFGINHIMKSFLLKTKILYLNLYLMI